jgi:rod shape-determining protein MreC
METFLNRYRNITVLLLVIFAQLILLAVQVKNDQDVRMIRVWTITAVTPVARFIESLRGGSSGFVHDYVLLHDTHEQNLKLKAEVDRLKLENIFLKDELNQAERAKALALFQSHTPSKTVAASVIGTGAGTNSQVVLVDRGSGSGVQRGMAVVTPDGIVGKVIAAYPTASQVMLITDPDFAAGVISQKNQVRGTLKGQGTPLCKVDYVPGSEKVESGEWFYTSGDDRIFPRGFPVGVIKTVRPGQPFQEIYVEPAGLQRGREDVLILLEGVEQEIPKEPVARQPVYIAPPPSGETQAVLQPAGTTVADKLRAQYKAIGDAQGHKFGEGLPGGKPPDFNFKIPANGAAPHPVGGAASKPAPNQAAPVEGAPATSRPPATGLVPTAAAPAGAKPPAPAPGNSTTSTPKPAAPAVGAPVTTKPRVSGVTPAANGAQPTNPQPAAGKAPQSKPAAPSQPSSPDGAPQRPPE